MKIHIFGDSHASDKISGWKDCRNIMSYHLGPVLCHSFGRDKLKRLDISKYPIDDDDIVLFCFGEIDCRCHVHKYISPDKTYQSIIDELIQNYMHAVKTNVEKCKARLAKICVYNVVPTVRRNDIKEHKRYPHLGTDEERKRYVLYFNQKLRNLCNEYGYVYFDIYDKYVDSEGFLNKDLSDGSVHIRDGCFLQDFIDLMIQ